MGSASTADDADKYGFGKLEINILAAADWPLPFFFNDFFVKTVRAYRVFWVMMDVFSKETYETA
jgi:hypothetical protein